METVTLTIDGRPITVEKGKTVLQAAIESGISVPYYCYHPGIGIDGSCRVCIVKIEKMPKLQTSCSTVCTDGMVVHTRTAEVVEARAGVFEFLLDQSSARLPGLRQGRRVSAAGLLLHVRPRSEPDGVPAPHVRRRGRARRDVDFGPTLMLNRNRCILCTRCVRFMRDIEGDAQINIIDRGYGSEIATFQEEGVHSLISGQPDGRLPGRRHHDARLPVQVAALGQPERGRHDLHAVLEGLQHDRLDQGQAGVGQGLAAHPLHAALQPRRQRLLDVRHRPLRLPLDRGRRPRLRRPLERVGAGGVAAAVAWHDVLSKLCDRLAARASRTRTACASCCRRTRRTKSSSCSAGSPRSCSASRRGQVPITVGWRYQPKAQPAAHEVHGAAVDAPNVNGARMLGLVAGSVGDEAAQADVSALRAAVEAGQVVGALRVRPGPRRLARRHRVDSRARAARRASAAHRARRAAHRPGAGRRFRPARAHRWSRRKRPIRTSRAGCRERRARFRRPARRGRLADSRQPGRRARRAARLHRARAGPGRHRRAIRRRGRVRQVSPR